MAHRRGALALMALALAAAPASSQSLGELARQEAARRAAGSKSVRALSNADLKPGAVSSPATPVSPAPAVPSATPVATAAPASCYVSMRLGRCVTAEELVANSVPDKQTRSAALEPKWREDAESIRSQIERTQLSIANLERVVADPARSAGDKAAAGQTLVSAQKALAGFERQWIKFERLAGNQRIPLAWLEPIPTLSSRPAQQ